MFENLWGEATNLDGIPVGREGIEASIDGPRIIELDEDNAPDHADALGINGPSITTVARVHRSKQRASCPICGLDILKKTRQRHIRTIHRSLESSLSCSVCGLICTRKDVLERHMSEQHGTTRNLVRCDTCREHIVARALKAHRQSDKCRNARPSAQKSTAIIKKSHCVDHPSELGALPMIDPLCIAAGLNLLTCSAFLIWDRNGLKFATSDSRGDVSPGDRYKSDLFRLVAEMWGLWRFPDHLYPNISSSRFIDQQACFDPHLFAEICKLRSVALKNTRRAALLRIHRSTMKYFTMQDTDDLRLQIRLLGMVDGILFGGDSPEYQSHYRGLTALWTSTEPIPNTLQRLNDVLQAVGYKTRAPETDIWSKFAGLNRCTWDFDLHYSKPTFDTDCTATAGVLSFYERKVENREALAEYITTRYIRHRQ